MFHAEIEATNHCNTRCAHCPHETMSRPRGRMSWETFQTIVDRIRRHTNGERYSLSFSGMGEPLLNPLLPRFIAHVSAEARTSFASNGSALTPENVRRLRDAGLDQIYFSFNGDEPELFGRMMGGLPFERVTRHLRAALDLARGTRLEISANVSLTKATQPHATRIRDFLEREGVQKITFSQCHSRGGNLRDTTVCDTPASPADLVHCDVIRHTLFVDWRGVVHICDHDLHGEHPLGDLMTEPLASILERRQQLIDRGMPFKLCRNCNDLLKGGFTLFDRGVGGVLTDWLYELYSESDHKASFTAATPAQRWMLQLYQREGRLDRAVNRLLKVERELQDRVTHEVNVRQAVRTVLQQEVANRDARIAELEDTLAAFSATRTWRLRNRLLTVKHWLERTTAEREAVHAVL